MEFSPNNHIVKLCLQGMGEAEKGKHGEADRLFLQAWNEAADDSEKFIAAHAVARHQKNVTDKLAWLDTALQLAVTINDDTVKSALPFLYTDIAKCYEDLGDMAAAKHNFDIATTFTGEPSDTGPFYHGTKADLRVGDMLVAGGESNYQSELKMNHIYFTALVNGAGLAASLAKGDGRERVYIIEPTGIFEHDPNVTNKKFPGNPTRSYRSTEPLRIVGEVTDWVRQTPEQIGEWRAKLAKNKRKVIN